MPRGTSYGSLPSKLASERRSKHASKQPAMSRMLVGGNQAGVSLESAQQPTESCCHVAGKAIPALFGYLQSVGAPGAGVEATRMTPTYPCRKID